MAAAWSIPRAKLGELFASQEGGLIRPLTHRFMERVLGGDYAGGMPTEAARKDSTLALQLAEHTKIPLFTIQAAHTAYELGMAAGLGRQDYASIATLWEGWTGLPLRDSDSDGGTGG
jgi:3-hydroxyisobutyrate dehydrogenase